VPHELLGWLDANMVAACKAAAKVSLPKREPAPAPATKRRRPEEDETGGGLAEERAVGAVEAEAVPAAGAGTTTTTTRGRRSVDGQTGKHDREWPASKRGQE
jgi:hypothetical protein